jgi:DtxR family Mn-dependent transcriptional regulator
VLKVSKGTASSSLKQLAEAGLVEHLPYEGVSLTVVGARQAARAGRRRLLLQLYLMTTLGMNWEAADEEARRLDAAASDELIERIDHKLAHPGENPNGESISGAGGNGAE